MVSKTRGQGTVLKVVSKVSEDTGDGDGRGGSVPALEEWKKRSGTERSVSYVYTVSYLRSEGVSVLDKGKV